MDNKYTRALEKSVRDKKKGEKAVMSTPHKKNEAEIYDLSKSDDEIQRQATIKKVLELENQNQREPIIQLMLDTYKKKVESSIREELEARIRSEYERKYEVDRIKNNYETLQFERERLRIKDLEDKLKKEQEIRNKIESTVDSIKEEKYQLDVKLAKEINSKNALEEEKRVIAQTLEDNKKKHEITVQQFEVLQKNSDDFSKQIKDLQGLLDQKDHEINTLRETFKDGREELATYKALRKKELKNRIDELEGQEEKYKDEIYTLKQSLNAREKEFETKVNRFKADKDILLAESVEKDNERNRFSSQLQSMRRERDDLKEALDNSQRRINEKEAIIETFKGEQKNIHDRVVYLENQIDKFRDEIENNRKLLSEKDIEIGRIANELEYEKKNSDSQREEIQRDKKTIEDNLQSSLKKAETKDQEINELHARDKILQAESKTLLEKLDALTIEKENLQNFTVKSEEEKKSLLDNFDSLKKSLDEKNSDIRHMTLSFEEEKKHLLSLIERVKEEKDKIERDFVVLEKEEKSHKWEIEFLKKYVKERTLELEKQESEFRKDRHMLETLARESKEAQENLERKAKGLELDVQNLISERDKLLSDNKFVQDEINRLKGILENERVAHQTVLVELRDNEEKFKAQISAMENKKEELERRIEGLQTALQDTETDKARISELEEVRKGLENKIQDQHSAIDEEKGLVAKLSHELDELRSEKQVMENQLAERHDQDKNLIQEAENLRRSLEEKGALIEKLQEEIKVLNDEKLKTEEHGNLFRDEIARVALDKLKIEESYNEVLSRLKIIEKERNDLSYEKSLLVDTVAEKESSISKLHEENNVLSETLSGHNKHLDDNEKKLGEQSSLISKYESVIAALEKEKKQLLHENDLRLSETSSLKRELTSISQTAEDSLAKIDRESMKRIKLEKENTLLQEKFEHLEAVNQNLSIEVQNLKNELKSAQKSLQFTVTKSGEDEAKNKEEIDSLRNNNIQLTSQLKNLTDKLKEIDILESEKILSRQEIDKTKKELDLLKNELESLKKQNEYLTGELTKERSSSEELFRSSELLRNERRLLENNIKSYNHSLQDMQLLLDSEKERSKSLEREREHLKKCLDISQRAFKVNEKLSNLKTNDD